MPKSELYNLIVLTIIYLTIFTVTEWFYIKTKTKAEHTRKFIHISCGLISLTYVILFNTIWPVIIITSAFALLLYSTKKLNYLNSIHNITRESYGSYLFPITILFCFSAYLYFDNSIYYYLPFIIMVLSDPIAAIVGSKYPIKRYKSGKEYKSIGGSLAFFISASLISYFMLLIILKINTPEIIFYSAIIAGVSTFFEGLSKNGVDNILIPISIVITIFILNF